MIAQADIGLLDGFERALINNRLHLVYQPKVSLADGTLKRVEALVRWDDPALGSVPPSRFVPLAERHGMIDPLTHWGLRTALRQWRDWHAQGIDLCLAFNISALSLDQLDFPDLVERMCRALDVPTDRLVLELTEGATQPLIKLMDTLTRFRIKGIGLAIAERFAVVSADPAAIVYCGSGVTACHNALAIEAAGLPRPRVYIGSWSGWSSDPERPVATA